jgi:glycosyltransferase involved in cell wall biosynthesis
MSVENSVSIIIPTYNRGRILSKSIKSILEQSYPYWELLIVDDCSTDATTKIGNQFSSFIHQIIKIIFTCKYYNATKKQDRLNERLSS